VVEGYESRPDPLCLSPLIEELFFIVFNPWSAARLAPERQSSAPSSQAFHAKAKLTVDY
jgi:hypothetical protein